MNPKMRRKTASCLRFSARFFSKFYVFTILIILYSTTGFQPVIGRYLQNQEKIPSMSLNFFSNLFAFVVWSGVYLASKMVCFRRTVHQFNAHIKRVRRHLRYRSGRRRRDAKLSEHDRFDVTPKKTAAQEMATEGDQPNEEPLQDVIPEPDHKLIASASQSSLSSGVEEESTEGEFSLKMAILTILVTGFFCLVFLFVRYTKSAANLFSSKFTSAVYVQLISITSPLFVSLFNGIIALCTICINKLKAKRSSRTAPVTELDPASIHPNDAPSSSLPILERADSGESTITPHSLSMTAIPSVDSFSHVGPLELSLSGLTSSAVLPLFPSYPETPSAEVIIMEKDVGTPHQVEPIASYTTASLQSNTSSSSIPVLVKNYSAPTPPIDTRKIFTIYMALFMLITIVGGILISLGSFSAHPEGIFTWNIQISFKNIKNPMENLAGLSLGFYSNISNAIYSIITASSTGDGKNSFNKFRMGVLNLSIFQSGCLTVLFFIGARVLEEPIWIWGRLSGQAWMYLFIYSFTIYLVADSIMILAVKLVGSNNTMALLPTSLIFTLVFSALFLGEMISNIWQIIGCCIVMCGVIGFSVSKSWEIQRKIWKQRRKLRGLPAHSYWKLMFKTTTRVIQRKKRPVVLKDNNAELERKRKRDFIMHSVIPTASTVVVQS